MSKPFFSIVIPTYNRAKYLACAIQGILQQKKVNVEIIVSDNCSQDDTKKIVFALHDNRIRYFRNTKNIGWIANLQHAINQAQGKYIVLHGDDDYFFNKHCLFEVHKRLSENPVGFVRLNYLTYTKQNDNLFDVHPLNLKERYIKPKTDGDKVMSFIQAIDPFFITGQIFERNYLRNNALIQSEYVPWFPVLFDAIQHQGGLFLSEYYFVASWSKNDNARYKMIGGKFTFEQYFEEVKKRVTHSFYKKFLSLQLAILISEFPAARYYSSLAKFRQYAFHIFDLDISIRKTVHFWIYFFVSYCTPKFVLFLLKKYAQHGKHTMNYSKIYDSVAIFRKIGDDTTNI